MTELLMGDGVMLIDIAGSRYVTNSVSVRDRMAVARSGLATSTQGSSWTYEANVAQEIPCRGMDGQVVALASTYLEGRVEEAINEAVVDAVEIASKLKSSTDMELQAIAEAEDLCEEGGAISRLAGRIWIYGWRWWWGLRRNHW